MAFKSLTEGVKRRGAPRGSGHPSALTVRVIPGGKSKTGDEFYIPRMQWRIAQDLWVEALLKRGDKVEVLYDRDAGLGCIRLCDQGYTLCRGGSRFDLIFLHPYLEETGFPMFRVQTGMRDIRVENGEIYFSVPEETTMKPMATSQQGKQRKRH